LVNNNMKELKKIHVFFYFISICILFFTITPVSAFNMLEQSAWSTGDFDIPQKIKDVNTISELQSFLNSKDDFTRMAAVRRLGEIEGPNSLDTLISIFENEATKFDDRMIPLVRLEVIRAFGRIGTPQAKNALMSILKDIWEQVPDILKERQKDKRYPFYNDRDFPQVGPALLKELYKWSGDRDVYEMASDIVNNDEADNLYLVRTCQRAWEICIKNEALNKGITGEKETIIYLLQYRGDIGPLHESGIINYRNAYKSTAATNILEDFSEATFTSLLSELKEQQKTEQSESLRRRIGTLNAVLRTKKENQEKLEDRRQQIIEAKKQRDELEAQQKQIMEMRKMHQEELEALIQKIIKGEELRHEEWQALKQQRVEEK